MKANLNAKLAFLNKLTTWSVLIAMLAPYGAAVAQEDPRQIMLSEIEAEIEKQYEAETPGLHPSVADQMLDYSSKGVRKNVASMLTDFKMGVVNGARLARDGNVVVIGAKNGWKLFKKFGKAAGIHYVDSVYLLPKKAVAIGKDFAEAGKDIATIAGDGAASTVAAWKKTGVAIKKDAEEFRDGVKVINMLAGDAYKKSADGIVDGVNEGAQDAIRWSKDVYDWTVNQTEGAFEDLTVGTVKNVKGTGYWTKRVGKWSIDATVDAATSVNKWSKAAWDFTYDATSATWKATTKAGAWVFDHSTDAATDAAKWMGKNWNAPAEQAGSAIVDYSKWNWKQGYTKGLKEDFEAAAAAWSHDDQLMGTIWAVAGVGEATLHILLLEPAVVPFIAGYGVVGTAALTTIGFPSVSAMYAGGTVASGLTFAGGKVATGAVEFGGTAATLVAGGAGVVRTGTTAAFGLTATGATLVGGAAYTTGAAGVNFVRTVGTPFVGLAGMTATTVASGAEIAGSAAWGGTKMLGITALTGLGYTVLGGYEAAKMLFSTVQAVGVTVFDNAIVTPLGVVTNLAQALGSGAWTLTEDPIKGTLNVLAAGGIAIGTIVTSTGGFSYHLLKGMLFGLGHGIAAVAHSGIWVVGAVAKAGEFVYSAFNIPKHREWARFRKEEVVGSFAEIKKDIGGDLSERLGDIILVRVNWWGEGKGNVRFFVSKNKKTGERWFFKRMIDPRSCEVLYKVTNQDPLVRAFTKKPWTGTYESGLHNKACEAAKASK